MQEDERHLIADVPLSLDAQTELKDRFRCTLLYPRPLSGMLWETIDQRRFNRQRTLLVFPGNGASIVRSLLPVEALKEWWVESVAAKRFWTPGSDPWVQVGMIFESDRLVLGVRDVVVVDDVISSGRTCTAIKKRHEVWIPGARWHAAAWVRQRAARLKGFHSIMTPVEIGSPRSKVPINSLSTFLAQPEIACRYAKRNFPGAEQEFLKLIHGCLDSDTVLVGGS